MPNSGGKKESRCRANDARDQDSEENTNGHRKGLFPRFGKPVLARAGIRYQVLGLAYKGPFLGWWGRVVR